MNNAVLAKWTEFAKFILAGKGSSIMDVTVSGDLGKQFGGYLGDDLGGDFGSAFGGNFGYDMGGNSWTPCWGSTLGTYKYSDVPNKSVTFFILFWEFYLPTWPY